jgi:hypothetical protein
MRIILSRKGFDSASGGCPSPILPDGRLRCLPIPDNKSFTRYASIYSNDVFPTGKIVESLTKQKILSTSRAHLDPDIDPNAKLRDKNWLGVFGQCGSSQSHLEKQGVKVGDVFLFFGLFRQTDEKNEKLNYRQKTRNRHVFWGWMQIDKIIRISNNITNNQFSWCSEHPHVYYPKRINNVIYIATKTITIPELTENVLPGFGVFPKFNTHLQLTAEESEKPSIWRLPEWFSPYQGKALSYHTDFERWRRCDRYHRHVLLESVGRGQEFVIDISDDKKSKEWLVTMLSNSVE